VLNVLNLSKPTFEHFFWKRGELDKLRVAKDNNYDDQFYQAKCSRNLTIPASVGGFPAPPADFAPQDPCRTLFLGPWCRHTNMPSCPLAKVVGVLEGFVKLPQLTVLEMEASFRIE
jgi:hypothetical protein